MEWFVFALLAPILWSGCNLIDKFLLEKYVKDPISYEFLISLFNTISIAIILFLYQLSSDFYGFILGITIGIIGVIAVIFYNKSMIDEEASRVVPLAYIDSIFVVILAYVFLGEILNLPKYLGIILIVLGGMLISFKKIAKKWHFSSAVKFILIAGFLWGVTSVISKYTLGIIDQFSLTAWQLIGYQITVPFFLLSGRVRKNFLRDVKKVDKKVFSLMIINTLIYLVAILSFYFAVSISSISLVFAIASTQPFFIFIYTLIITKTVPEIIREDIDKSTILLKIIAILLIFLGTFLIGS
jgi:drug/metabolite transporter (DMT)-like permease